MRKILIALAIAGVTGLPMAVDARHILISNDDGLTSNVKALYDALKAQGHDVVVSVPCANQSGMGAAIRFMTPLGPLHADCRNGAAKAGDPGAGPMTRAGFERDFFYVGGTPVMATLYGVNVVAMTRWGHAPDLVLSGPNEGQNVGSIALNSGTVSNAQAAGALGIPAIALSAGFATIDDKGLASPQSARIALLAARLVSTLEANAHGGALLPARMALNVNFPDDLDGAAWKLSTVGSYDGLTVRFVTDLAAAPHVGPTALSLPHLPGVTVAVNDAAPTPAQRDDESVVYRHAIAVSPMQIGYAPRPMANGWLARRLKGLATR